MNKKKILIITIICTIILTIIGTTVAFFGWRAEDALVSVTVSSGIGSCDRISDNEVLLEPTTAKEKGRIIKLSAKQLMSNKAYITWNLVVNNIDELQHESFRYELINNTTGVSYGSGSFENINNEPNSNTITFENQEEKLKYDEEYEFILYLWIDGVNFNNPYTMGGKDFNFDMNCIITGAEDDYIAIPTCNTLTYNGNSQVLIDEGDNYTLTNNTGVNAGEYNVTATLNEDCFWTDGETGDKVVTCNINKKNVTVTTLNQTITYGNNISSSISNISSNGLLDSDSIDDITLSSNATNVGTGNISTNNIKIVNSNNTDVTSNYNIIKNNTGVVTINCANIAVEPNAGNVMYTGSEVTGVTGGSYITITGTKTAIEEGTYTAVAKPNENYCWSDSTTEEKEYTWNIQYGEYQVVLDRKGAGTGTEVLYGRENEGIYLDSGHTNKMTSNSNPITVPTKTGYTFAGYYTGENGEGTLVINTDGYLVSDISSTTTVLYAKWITHTYTIAYSANGGTGTTAGSSHDYDVSKALTANGFTRTGYTFLGWSTNSSATTATYTNNQSVKNLTATNNGTITLYAIWRINKVYVRFNTNGGTVTSQTTAADGTIYNWTTETDGTVYKNSSIYQLTVNYGASTSAGALPNYNNSAALNIKRTGYSAVSNNQWICLFGCTTANKTFNQASVAYAASDFCNASNSDCTVELGVNWTINKYTISFNANGGSGAPSAQTKTHGTTLKLSSTTPTRTGYTFKGWSTSNTATTATYQAGGNFTSNTNTTLYAVWKDETPPSITYYLGKQLYENAEFEEANTNGLSSYGGTTLTRKTMSNLPVENTSGYVLEVKSVRTNSIGGYGGFGWSTSCAAGSNSIYVTRIIAKIPSGYVLEFASNGYPDGAGWLTNNWITGDWYEYFFYLPCKAPSTAFTTNFFYIDTNGGAAPSTSNPITWYVAYATVIDIASTTKTFATALGIDNGTGIVGWGANTTGSTPTSWTSVNYHQYAAFVMSATMNIPGTRWAFFKDGAGNIGKKSITT